jgi:hypothetical protein
MCVFELIKEDYAILLCIFLLIRTEAIGELDSIYRHKEKKYNYKSNTIPPSCTIRVRENTGGVIVCDKYFDEM